MYSSRILLNSELVSVANNKPKYDMNIIKSMQIDFINKGNYDRMLKIEGIKKLAMQKIYISKLKNKMLVLNNNILFVFYNEIQGYEDLELQHLSNGKEIKEFKYDKEEQINLVVQSDLHGSPIHIRYDSKLFEAYRNQAKEARYNSEIKEKREYSLNIIGLMEELIKSEFYGYRIELAYTGKSKINYEIMKISPSAEGFYKVWEKGMNTVIIYSSISDVRYNKREWDIVAYGYSDISEQLSYIDKYRKRVCSIWKDRKVINENNR